MVFPKLRQLQYFDSLAKTGSFSRAAEICHVTQSTLSAGIKELEDLLGETLFDRSTRRIVLTPFGRSIADDTQNILETTQNMLNKARLGKDPFKGSLRLGVIPTIAPYLLPQILPALNAQYPDMDLQIHEDLTARLIADLNEGLLDFVLLALPYDVGKLEEKILYSEPFLAACPKNMFPAGKTLSLGDLVNKPVLLLEDGHCLRDHALTACKLTPESNWKSFRASSLPTLIEMVRHGYGLTLLPLMAVKSMQNLTDLDVHPFVKPVPSRDIGLVWRRGGLGPHMQGAFFTSLRNAMKPFAE